ncbi:hypothetical protein FHW23_000686 [Curtobacterium pusillum]|uniref:Uncharacterized protein n=1 Tax=Curtobacterium pusillum TaxID=69373 RepID=A0AAW3T346_9MICO|nr:hypothetical protein [Curtobacterium pusillum]MBA8989454.1 hypothetical protein [Curtobacterium pusillum]
MTHAVVIGGTATVAFRALQLGAGIYFGHKAITSDGERAERAHELARVLMSRRLRRKRKK